MLIKGKRSIKPELLSSTRENTNFLRRGGISKMERELRGKGRLEWKRLRNPGQNTPCWWFHSTKEKASRRKGRARVWE